MDTRVATRMDPKVEDARPQAVSQTDARLAPALLAVERLMEMADQDAAAATKLRVSAHHARHGGTPYAVLGCLAPRRHATGTG